MDSPKYIPIAVLRPFLDSYENEEVWQVHCGDRWLKVWLYFNNQIESHRNLPVYQTMREEYYKLVQQHLDLNLSSIDEISISFETKENLDTNYMGNMAFYYH